MNAPAFTSRQIGDFRVTALSDGTLPASLDVLSGIAPAEAEDIQRRAGIAEPGNIHINCYLIQGREKTILVDAGTGGLYNAGGLLEQNLRAVGVTPEDVDIILLTHGHPDHIGGLLDAEGCPVYPHATLYVHPLEAKHWQDEAKFAQASERAKQAAERVRLTLHAYAHNLHLLSDDEIIEGIRPVWLPGHTPGHTGFQIDAEESLLIWGDIVHFPHIQSAQPGASVVYDYDAAQAEETRRAVLAQVANEKQLVAGMHFAISGFAYVLPAAQGYRLAYENGQAVSLSLAE